MNIQEFTNAIQAQFINGTNLNLTPDSDFRDTDGFDSLTGMAILVMIEDHFKYKMSVPDFLKCKTPADLYNFIQNAKK